MAGAAAVDHLGADPAAYRAAVAALDAAGRPVADHCRGTLAVAPDRVEPGWRAMLAALPPGVTHLALHATAPGEFAAVAPDHYGWRASEYALLARGAVAAMCAELGVAAAGCRAAQGLWRAATR